MQEKQLSHFRCQGCGEFLPAGRKHARFHDSACRSRFWRAGRDVELHASMIQGYLLDMANLAAHDVNIPAIEREFVDIMKTMRCLAAYLPESAWQKGLNEPVVTKD